MLDIHTSQIELDELLLEEDMDNARRSFIRGLQIRVSDFLDPDFPQNESLHELIYDLAFILRASDVPEREMVTASLTPKESEVLSRLELGEPIKGLAQSLFISEATAKTHLQSIYRKLGVANRAEAIHVARRSGLLK